MYPEAIFERRREYGMSVWMSRHPELNDLIHEVRASSRRLRAPPRSRDPSTDGHLRALSRARRAADGIAQVLRNAREMLIAGGLRTLSVVLLRDDGSPIEQFAFDLDVAAPEDVPATYHDLYEMLSATMMRLSTLEVHAPPPHPDEVHTFTVLVEARRDESAVAAALAGPSGGGAGGESVSAPTGLSSTSRKRARDSAEEGRPFWMRVDAEDPESALVPSAAATLGHAPPHRFAIKSVRVGRLRIQLALLRHAARRP